MGFCDNNSSPAYGYGFEYANLEEKSFAKQHPLIKLLHNI